MHSRHIAARIAARRMGSIGDDRAVEHAEQRARDFHKHAENDLMQINEELSAARAIRHQISQNFSWEKDKTPEMLEKFFHSLKWASTHIAQARQTLQNLEDTIKQLESFAKKVSP